MVHAKQALMFVFGFELGLPTWARPITLESQVHVYWLGSGLAPLILLGRQTTQLAFLYTWAG